MYAIRSYYAELAAFGARRVLVIHTPGRAAVAKRVAADLGAACAGMIGTARQHVSDADAAAAAAKAIDLGADWLFASYNFV